MFFDIPNIYFYYFYLPITAMTAETLFDRIEDKFKGFIYTMLGSSMMVLLFNSIRPYPFYFLFTVFICTILFYILAIHWKRMILPLVPIILSLATYSLLYSNLNTNFNMIINNMITTLFALIIIVSALILFPLSYYYRSWLRAFVLLLQEIIDNLCMIYEKKRIEISLIQGHTKHMVTFANMLPRQLPTRTILKINLLVNQLHLASCVDRSPFTEMSQDELQSLINEMIGFIESVRHDYHIHEYHMKELDTFHIMIEKTYENIRQLFFFRKKIQRLLSVIHELF
jgi:hypothetical protein